MTNCSAPGAHCAGGVGFSGGVTSGVYTSGGGHRRKVPRSRRYVKPKQYEPIDPFALTGRLAFHLKGNQVEQPHEGLAQWFSSRFGMLSKQVEKYSLEEFLEKFSRFLKETLLENILAIEIDYYSVYKDRKDKSLNDLDNAIAAARDYVSHHKNANKILISALGKTKLEPRKDLHLTIESQYYRKHGSGKPGMELYLTGIPSILLPRKKETNYEYKTREIELSKNLSKPRKRKDFMKGSERTLEIVMKDYVNHVKKFFDVDSVESLWKREDHPGMGQLKQNR
jgi:hypothetical protein